MASLDINVRQANADFQAVKDKIITNGVDVAEGTPTADYASKIDEVYEAGRKSRYDEFWDEIQDYGKRVNYSLALCGSHWTKRNFKPKYPIKPTLSMANCFAYWNELLNTELIDFREVCELDTSNVQSINSAFYANRLVYAIGTLDLRNANAIDGAFNAAISLVIIEKIILGDNYKSFNNMFYDCKALEEVRFEGEIRLNNLNLQWSTKLSHDSLMSIINALRDNSGTDTWNTITLGAENLAKLTTEELKIMDTKQWEYT